MKKYQMVVSDFDGTLFRSDHTVSEKSKETIKKFVDAGGIFVISTGRSVQSILPIARGLGLKGSIICFNGAMIVDIQTGKRIFERKHTVQDTVDICKISESLGIYTLVLDCEQYYAKETSPYLENYQKITSTKAVLANKPLSEFVKERSVGGAKILYIVNAESRNAYLEQIEELIGERFYITSGSKFLVEICPKGVDKGVAVTFLAEYYGVPIQNVIAVGDSFNDLPMLKSAGLGLAVKNAETALKDVVEIYPYTNDENAVARIIEEYALEEIR